MALLYEVMPDDITRGSKGGPTMPGRTKTYTAAKKLKQNFVSGTRLHVYDYGYALRRKADFELLLGVFHVVFGGAYDGFLHKDWNDYRATSTNSALSLISGTNYQLQRKYTFGAATVTRDIQCPLDGSVAVYSAGGVLLGSTVDPETGIASVPSGTPAYWTGFFYVPVTFMDDAMENIEVDGYMGQDNELHGLPSIKLEEIRL